MARNIYQEVTDKIVASLEATPTGSYTQPWANLCKGSLPRNIASGRAYRGVNVLALWAADAGTEWWGTYQQWQAIGGQVRRGEKSSTVVFFQPVAKRSSKASATNEGTEQDNGSFLLLKHYSVFHRGQVDAIANEDGTPGIIALPAEQLPETTAERIDAAEAWFAAIGGTVNHGGDRAYYTRGTDRIQMPHFAQFSEAGAYYSTLAHEYIHWTGHESRLARTFGARFGDEAYAVEELVAELGAAFTMATLGLSAEPRADHAQYLQAWLKVLKADAKAIFTVASKAQAGAEYLATAAGAEEEAIAEAA